jgi:glycosyltransferase involved in cell wall biosynthesis
LFLEAASIVIKENPQRKVRFNIVGDGELRGELEEYSRKLNIAGYLEFTGWQKDLANVYADLDVVCLTSLNEGTPVSLIEAMAARRTVVATQVGGVVDLLGEEMEVKENFIVRKRGVTVMPNDTQGFAKALTFVLQNENIRKTLAIAAREYVKDRFSKERLVRDMEELYSRVLK